MVAVAVLARRMAPQVARTVEAVTVAVPTAVQRVAREAAVVMAEAGWAAVDAAVAAAVVEGPEVAAAAVVRKPRRLRWRRTNS